MTLAQKKQKNENDYHYGMIWLNYSSHNPLPPQARRIEETIAAIAWRAISPTANRTDCSRAMVNTL